MNVEWNAGRITRQETLTCDYERQGINKTNKREKEARNSMIFEMQIVGNMTHNDKNTITMLLITTHHKH